MDDFPGERSRRQDLRRDLSEPFRSDARPGAPVGQAREEVDLASLVSTVWRRKWIVALFGVGFGLLAMAVVYALTPRFQADAVVMLDSDEQQFIDLQSVVSGISTDFFTILAETEVLRSRKLAGRVVDELDLAADPRFNPDLVPEAEPPLPIALAVQAVELLKDAVRGAVTEREAPGRELLPDDYFVRQHAIDTLLKMQSVQSVDNTYVYRITIETVDPVLSARIANTFAEVYITDQLETKFEATQAATKWLSERVAELKSELEASEAAIEDYNSRTSLVSEQVLGAMSRQLKELRERRVELAASTAEAGARGERLRAAVEAGDYDTLAAESGVERIAELRDEFEALRAAGVGERAVATAEARLVAAADRLAARLISEAERADRQITAIDRSIAELGVQLEEQGADLVELRQLQREAEANRRIYEQFLRRLNETSVQQGVQQADARILSPATVDFTPSYPKKTITVLAMGFFGGLVGIAVVILLDWRDRTFRSAEDLETATGLSVLGQIPAAPVRRRRDLLSYARDRASSALMEAIRNLRTGVLLANIDATPKMVMLTSSLPKEGKTTCSLLLAQNAAAMGKSVLLIECDLRRRTFRSYFDIEGEAGLISILSGDRTLDEVLHRDRETGLHVVPGEETKANAADVFSSQRFADFLGEMRERFDFVVIDTPPVLAVPDARVIAPLVDAVLYCVRWNSTHRDLVRNGIAAFTQIKVRVTGLALTQINMRKMARYGYGGYDSRYYRSSSRYYVN
ncbi:MAG: polysaccharide biosynthesis tyrosine autokinase [Paracoccaceae bacterium]